MAEKKYVEVVEIATGKSERQFDVTGKSPRQVEQLVAPDRHR
jgi:hypothetical protein